MSAIQKLDGTSLSNTYSVTVRMPYRRGRTRYEKWGKMNLCFLTSTDRAFLHESPLVNLDCRQLYMRFDGPLYGNSEITRVLVRCGGVCDINEIVIDGVKYIPSWDNGLVFEKEFEYSPERYEANMNAYRVLKAESLYGGVIATLLGCGVILASDTVIEHMYIFSIGGVFGSLYQVLLQYDVDTLKGDLKLPVVLPIRLGLVIGLVLLINKITCLDPHIFMIGILGFMTNKVGLVWAGTRKNVL